MFSFSPNVSLLNDASLHRAHLQWNDTKNSNRYTLQFIRVKSVHLHWNNKRWWSNWIITLKKGEVQLFMMTLSHWNVKIWNEYETMSREQLFYKRSIKVATTSTNTLLIRIVSPCKSKSCLANLPFLCFHFPGWFSHFQQRCYFPVFQQDQRLTNWPILFSVLLVTSTISIRKYLLRMTTSLRKDVEGVADERICGEWWLYGSVSAKTLMY